MGKSQKNKGKRDKREAARKLTRLLGVLVQRTQQFEETFQSADIEDPLVLHLDVKWTKRLGYYSRESRGRLRLTRLSATWERML